MTVDELVSRACERAGLDDYGGNSWREGLALLVESCESAPGVNPGGREFVYGQFVDAMWNRLRVIDYIRCHPEVLNYPRSNGRWSCWDCRAPGHR